MGDHCPGCDGDHAPNKCENCDELKFETLGWKEMWALAQKKLKASHVVLDGADVSDEGYPDLPDRIGRLIDQAAEYEGLLREVIPWFPRFQDKYGGTAPVELVMRIEKAIR